MGIYTRIYICIIIGNIRILLTVDNCSGVDTGGERFTSQSKTIQD